jgi:hypothetical protein
MVNPKAVDEFVVPCLVITDSTTDEVISVVEFLSPSNKSGGDCPQFLGKRVE